jgi:hypothetical protein
MKSRLRPFWAQRLVDFPRLVVLKVAVSNSQKIEQPIKPEIGNRLVGTLADERFGAVSYAHAGKAEHGNVIGAIADCDNLFKRNSLTARDFTQ